MADTAGQWHALIDLYGRRRRPVVRSKLLLWPTPQAARAMALVTEAMLQTHSAKSKALADFSPMYAAHALVRSYRANTHRGRFADVLGGSGSCSPPRVVKKKTFASGP